MNDFLTRFVWIMPGGLEKGGLEHMLGPVAAIQWGFVENRVGSEQCRVEGY
jgi:hypothetical protein